MDYWPSLLWYYIVLFKLNCISLLIAFLLFISGKSTLARAECKGPYYLKDATKWWDFYDYEETVIIEDLTPALGAALASLLMLWCDLDVVRVDVKGSSMKIRPQTIIVTSTYTITECFPECFTRSMLARFSRQRHLTGSFSA